MSSFLARLHAARTTPLIVGAGIAVVLLSGTVRALTLDTSRVLAAQEVGSAQFAAPVRSVPGTITEQAALAAVDKTLRTYGPAKGKPYLSELRTYKELNVSGSSQLVWLFAWHPTTPGGCDFVIAIDAISAKTANLNQNCPE